MPEDIKNVRSWVEATESGDISVLEQLLDAGFDIDYKVDFPKPGEILEDWNGAPTVILEIDLAWDGVPGIVHAAKWGQISAVRFLLERGADVDNVNDTAYNIGSALLKASEAGHLEMVKLLLARGAKTDAVKVFQGTTTPLAAVAGLYPQEVKEQHREIIILLLDAGSDINAENENSKTALTLAVERGDMDLIKLLLGRGADVNHRAYSTHGNSALDEAAFDGRLDIVQLLMDGGAELKHETRSFTSLHRASAWGRLEVMKLLLRSGAAAEAAETDQTTALHEAASGGSTQAIKLLLDNGFNIEAKSTEEWETPLHQAAHWVRISAVELLLDSGADINAQDCSGMTALHHATCFLNTKEYGKRYPNLQVIKLLASRGADVNIPDHTGRTVLQAAIQCWETPRHSSSTDTTISGVRNVSMREPDFKAVGLLLAHGADINAKDANRSTALHRAAHEWNIAIIDLLLSAGADLEARKVDGGTPLFETVCFVHAHAGWRRSLEWTAAPTIEYLLEAGANINARMANGKTVLHVLVEGHEKMGSMTSREDREVVTLLLDHGVDFGAVDDEGRTPLMTAERIGKQDIAQLLKDHM